MAIDKISSEDKRSSSKDLVQENIDQLKKLFPEIVTEGKIDFKSLQQVLGEEIEDEEEFYRFTWAGKSKARREAHKPSTGTLRPCKKESLDWDTTQNLYIEGDNLEVLKLLQKSYAGKIKMIYIDPPYNTGKDFVYKDNYKDNLKNYQEVTGQIDSDGNKLSTNSDSDGRFHSNWLNMMYPRLRLARNLLTEDGMIFISIDDHEIENLKKLCDDILGENNFIGTVIWQRAFSPVNMNKYFSPNHDFIVCFSKSLDKVTRFGLPRSKESNDRYDNPDNDDRGIWTSGDFSVGPRIDSKVYEIELPSGRKVLPPSGRCWRVSYDRFKELENDNRVWFGSDGDGVPRLKRFLSEVQDKRVPLTIWEHKEVGHSQGAKQALNNLFDGVSVMDYPKSVELLKRVYNLNMEKDGIYLDFFSGSATSVQSLIELNLSDNGKRKFIQVQLPEKINEKDEPYKLGMKTICDIGKERIRRVVKIIKDKEPEKSKNMDLGFKVFKLDSSNIKSWDGNPDKLETSLFDSVNNIKTDRTEEDVLFEILLKYGLNLTLPIKERNIQGKKVFNVGIGSLFICLGDEITSKVAEGIGEWKEECDPEVCRVIFKDNGFTDVEKTNSVQILKRFGINEIRSI